MARSNFAVPYINPKHNITYLLNSIMSECGYKKTIADGEEVFFRVNKECNLTEYVKFDFEYDVFIFSAWIKVKDDADTFREYNLEHFGQNAKETKVLYDLISKLYDEYGGHLNLKNIYVWDI
ncbi:MAG: hypothetical protein IJM97_07100 [Clostridia bacterium]|nr:hypothetical protein [Clostridia bacterium]